LSERRPERGLGSGTKPGAMHPECSDDRRYASIRLKRLAAGRPPHREAYRRLRKPVHERELAARERIGVRNAL